MLVTLGMLLLIYTPFSLLRKTEDSVDHIWRIKWPRTLAARFRNSCWSGWCPVESFTPWAVRRVATSRPVPPRSFPFRPCWTLPGTVAKRLRSRCRLMAASVT